MDSPGPVQTSSVPGFRPATFREALGSFVTGVTIITTTDRGQPYGMTANAFSALSLEPCLVLVCLANRGRACRLIGDTSVFSANVLGSDQEWLSRRFAEQGRPRGDQTFELVPHTWGATRCPVILGAVAHVDCRVVDMLAGGDHTIIVGEVVAMESSQGTDPLVFYRGRYRDLAGQAPSPSLAGEGRRGHRQRPPATMRTADGPIENGSPHPERSAQPAGSVDRADPDPRAMAG